MRLRSIQISNYKCIRKPCELEVSDITCLVGKNESGKTAILEAIYRLNPIIGDQGIFNMDDDYPRMDVEDYRLEVESGQGEPAIVTRASFTLEETDLKEIEKDFPGVLAQPELIIAKGYKNELYAELTVKEDLAVDALLRKANFAPQQLKSLANCLTLDDLAVALEAQKNTEGAKQLSSLISEMKEKGFLRYLYKKYLEKKVPKFLYFNEFYQMKGHVNIQGLIQRKEDNHLLDSDYPLLGLIDLARLDLKEISNPKRALERDNRLEGASNHLTKAIMKYWSQNKSLEMRFDIRPALSDDPEGMQSGLNLWGHVYNSRQKVSTLLGRRSRGFVWFFSFLAWFSQQKRKNIPLILLLDEPSLFLHGSAQRDLLSFLEDETRSGLQVVYTAQSPFMVDPDRFDRVRIVEDKSMETEAPPADTREGTQVYVDVMKTAKESILSLQGALGYDICSSLFTESNILIVDSTADLVYLQTISAILEKRGQEGLDPHWAITPLGGSQKLPAFFSLLGYRKDGIIAGLMQINNDFNRDLLRKVNILSYADFTNSSEADIEDLFEIDFYLNLVNSEYKDVLRKPITKGHLHGSSSRIIELITKYLESMPLADGVKFNRYRPARYFVENIVSFEDVVSRGTVRRFENMFKSLNVLL